MIQEGDWQWPSDIKISSAGFEFLTTLLQFDPKLRPSWQTLRSHPYFRLHEADLTPLIVDFTQPPPEGIRFKEGRIYMNIKDPDIAQKMQDKLLADNSEKEEEQKDLETLIINHRLKMAEDLDLFEGLELQIDQENRLLEQKSERLAKLSMTISQRS